MKQLALLVVLVGCTTYSKPQDATQQFATDTGCTMSRAVYRADLSSPGDGPNTFSAFEASGCGKDIVYRCDFPYVDWHGDTASQARCEAQTWCTRPGCTTDFGGAAGDAFSRAKSCPSERVSVAYAGDPVRPPGDIAGDPERLAMWTRERERRDAGAHFVHASGCGAELTYRCDARAPDAPACADVAAGIALAPSDTRSSASP